MGAAYEQGRKRLEQIQEFLEQWGAADRESLEIFFPNRHRAQVVLNEWTKKKQLQRVRVDQYVYLAPGMKINMQRKELDRARQLAFFVASLKRLPAFWKVEMQGAGRELLVDCKNTFVGKGIRLYVGENPPPGAVAVDIAERRTAKEILKQYIKV